VISPVVNPLAYNEIAIASTSGDAVAIQTRTADYAAGGATYYPGRIRSVFMAPGGDAVPA